MTPSPRTKRNGICRLFVCGQSGIDIIVIVTMSMVVYLDDFFVRLVVNLYGGDGLLNVTQDHVEVLIIGLC